MIENFNRTVVTSNHSWSKLMNETVDGSHHFTVSGYSLAKGSGPGKFVSSDIFNVGGYDWAVYLFPDGRIHDDLDTFISVYIELVSEGTNVRALFEIKLIDQSGKGNHYVRRNHFDGALKRSITMKCRGYTWGYRRFCKSVDLESSEYLKNNSIQFLCTVGVVRNRVEKPRQYYFPVPPSNMGNDIKYLLDSGVGADITFLVGDEKFKAHKLVLAARSSVFKAQFFGNIGNLNLNEVEIVDIEPTVFKLMLQYIYSSDLPNPGELNHTTSVSTLTSMLFHLFTAAGRYGLDRLKLLCEAKLGEGISIDDVANTLLLAEQHRCLQLKAVCLKFAASNLKGA